jgi:uncharacterized membrane protein
MDVEIVPLIMRWFHMLGAMILVGGLLYLYFGLRGALPSLGDETRVVFRNRAVQPWKHFVALAFVLLLVSGFYNYLTITRHLHEEQPLYHALFGIKFLLALAAFAFVFIVTSTMSWSENLREKPVMWYLALLTSVAVVLIAGYMRMMPATVALP